jgi:hypothetical protein
VALAEEPFIDENKNVVRELEQSNPVRDRWFRTANTLRDISERETELIQQRCIRSRLVDRREIFPRHVLDDRKQKRVPIFDLSHDGRDRGETCGLCGTPTAFTGDQLVPILAVAAYENRLDNALHADRVAQLCNRVSVEAAAWLPPVRPDRSDRQLDELLGRRHRTDQKLESAAQASAWRCRLLDHRRSTSSLATR